MSRRRKTRKAVWQPLLVSCVAVTIAFCLCEVLARARKQWHETGYLPSSTKGMIYELSPGYRMEAHGARINQHGMNDREFTEEKNQDHFELQ
jgi:hypothetical protein